MAPATSPDPMLLFVAMLYAPGAENERQAAVDDMVALWGPIGFTGPDRPFDLTSYYVGEMGESLCRRLIGFDRLVSPEILASAKVACNDIEDRHAREGKRTVNLDVGVLDHNKIVLASLKSAGQKIYLAQGVYADLVARYKGGRYQPFEWTFPDFKDGRYDADLAELRRMYLTKKKEQPCRP